MPRLPRALLPSLLLLVLQGCSTLGGAAEDRTRLRGQVPAGLGRSLDVHLDGGDAETRGRLLVALEREFVQRDLFDRVDAVPADAPLAETRASGLWVTVLGEEAEGFFDLIELGDVYVARYELEIELRGPGGEMILSGHVSGIGVDTVTDHDHLSPQKQLDIQLAALHDAASKMSRALRQAASARATKAITSLPRLKLAPGMGPVAIAVLGFEQDESARRRRGPALRGELTRALEKMGPELTLIEEAVVARALEREPPSSLARVTSYELDSLLQHLPAVRFLVVGRLTLAGGRVSATVRLVDRSGEEVFSKDADAEGLGALQVLAVKLARRLGEGLQQLQP